MADTELKGEIKLTLDNSEVEKGLDEIDSKQAQKSKPKEAGKDFAATFLSELKKNIQNALSGAFNSMGSAGKAFGTSLKSFMSSPAAGPASGTSGAGSLAGGAEAGEGAAGGAAEGGIAAGGMAGPIGLAIAVGVGAIVKMAGVVKGLIEDLVAFGRSLADVSASMGMAFGKFDMQITQLKNQIGEAIAPEMDELLTQIAELARDVLPIVILGLKVLLTAVAGLAKAIHLVIQLAEGAAMGPIKAIGNALGIGSGGLSVSNDFKQALDSAFPGAGTLIKALSDWLGDQKDKDVVKNTGADMIGSFQDILKRRDAQAAKDQAAIQAQMNRPGNAPPQSGIMPVRFAAGMGME